jgi:predicted DsbA family dithiol-disulfide isomerase
MTADDALAIEVFADVLCPFTHVGMRRFAARRETESRPVVLWVRAWPLEIVNGEPLDPDFVGHEVDALQASVAPDLFIGFDSSAFPGTAQPALALAAAGYRRDKSTGEAVSLVLRDLLFERGADISDPGVLAEVEARFGVTAEADDVESVAVDHREGEARGVMGSPHFFTPDGSFFCPSLEIGRDHEGELEISFDQAGFTRFVDACFG